MNKNIIFGLHAVHSLLERQPLRVLRLCLLDNRRDAKIKDIILLANKNKIAIEYVSKESLDEISDDANHQGVLGFCHGSKVLQESDLIALLQQLNEPAFLLILDGVQDPHNLGACFRSADAAGVHAIIAPKDKAVGITPTVSKVASGAAETVPFIQVTNLARTIQALKDQHIWIYGLAGEAKLTIYQTDLKGAIAIVMGAEGEGLRRLTRDLCDELIKIPMAGSVSSLNVSVATGVSLFEAVRQRVV